jgi:predicted TIM-barrel fold metal-dependent hydrolase
MSAQWPLTGGKSRHRAVWGSNWPHPGRGKTREDIAPPHDSEDGAQINQLPRWAVDPATRKKILVDNPTALRLPGGLAQDHHD